MIQYKRTRHRLETLSINKKSNKRRETRRNGKTCSKMTTTTTTTMSLIKKKRCTYRKDRRVGFVAAADAAWISWLLWTRSYTNEWICRWSSLGRRVTAATGVGVGTHQVLENLFVPGPSGISAVGSSLAATGPMPDAAATSCLGATAAALKPPHQVCSFTTLLSRCCCCCCCCFNCNTKFIAIIILILRSFCDFSWRLTVGAFYFIMGTSFKVFR